MELSIRNNGIKVTDGMREFIDKRMAKFDRLVDNVVEAQLELKSETSRTGAETFVAQLTLQTGKLVIRSEAEADEPAKAIDVAIDRLTTQVRKVNDRRKQRHRSPVSELVDPIPVEIDATADGSAPEMDPLPSVTRTKTFQMDPMGIETAIEQMELIGHDFFFFKNEEDETFTVLYRRKDGSYGLLSPD